MNKKTLTSCVSLAIAAGVLSSVAVRAANFSWTNSAPDNYTNPLAWDSNSVPGILDTAIIGNATQPAATVLYTNALSDPLSTNRLTSLQIGAAADTSAFTMSDGVLLITNTGGSAFNLGTVSGGAGNFTQNGGTLVVARPSTASLYYQDSATMGQVAGSTGNYTINDGLAAFLCGIEIGNANPATGTFTVSGGTVIDNGWFGVGRGNNSSGTFSLSGGAMYILRNPNNDGTGNDGGVSLCQGGTNGVANISGGTLYCTDIRFNTLAAANESLNVSGGDLYIGYIGLYRQGAAASQNITISGGTFHTADMLPVTAGSTIGDTNTILSDGTNWAWNASLPVNLTNSTFLVNGSSGPGYVTFAPEATRTITLNNVWSGVGGLVVNGPGTLAMGGANTYTGDTTISQGALALTGSGSIASLNIIVAGGATLDASASSFSLGSGQTLTNSSSGAVVNGLSTSSGTVSLVYDGSTPPLTTASGTLTLDSATVFNVNNTGSALPLGDYKIISSTGGAVGGAMPPVTVTGGGIAAGAASLYVSGGELYLSVAAAPVINSQNPSNSFSLYESQNFTLSVTASGSALSYQWYTNGVADTAAGTSSTYVLTDVQQAQSGVTYQCIITNSLGADTNQQVTLTVLPLPSFLNSSAYSTNILAMRPTAYWPMHETTATAPGNIETNYGTLGALGNGYYADWNLNGGSPGNTWIQHQFGGALANDSDGAAEFNINGTTNSYLLVPHTSPETTLRPPFTVECWVFCSAANQFGDILSQDGTKLNGGNANNSEGFRLSWNRGGTANNGIQTYGTAGALTGGNTPDNQWHYVAVTYDGTNQIMYVDGGVAATGTHTGYVVDYWDPLTIGNGLWNSAGPTRPASHLAIDEVAIYDTNLDQTVLDNHYDIGTNGAAGQYFEAITNSNPVLYYRMNSPAYSAPPTVTWPVVTNYGGTPVNGVYMPGTTPGGVAGPTNGGGASVSGLTSTNAMPGNGMSGFADAGYDSAFDPTGNTPLTVSAWFKGNPVDGRFQNILGHSDKSWRIGLDGTKGKLHFNAGAGGEITSAKIYNDGNWHQVVATFSGRTNDLYVDGRLDTENTNATNNITGSPADVLLGADPQYVNANSGVGRQFAGNLCEVAFWNGTVLDAAQVKSLYMASGQDRAPSVANPVTNSVTFGLTLNFALSDLATVAGWNDPDGDIVTLNGTDATSALGTALTSDSIYIYYNGPVTAEDHFNYTVTDGFLTATGTVYVEATTAVGTTIQNATLVGGHPTFSGAGIPGYTYGVEYTTSLTSPITWHEAGTVTAAANGKWAFTDATNSPPVFFRLYYPDNPGNPPQ